MTCVWCRDFFYVPRSCSVHFGWCLHRAVLGKPHETRAHTRTIRFPNRYRMIDKLRCKDRDISMEVVGRRFESQSAGSILNPPRRRSQGRSSDSKGRWVLWSADEWRRNFQFVIEKRTSSPGNVPRYQTPTVPTYGLDGFHPYLDRVK